MPALSWDFNSHYESALLMLSLGPVQFNFTLRFLPQIMYVKGAGRGPCLDESQEDHSEVVMLLALLPATHRPWKESKTKDPLGEWWGCTLGGGVSRE